MSDQTLARPNRVLTHVPLADAPLPEWDRTLPLWPGAIEEFGDLRLHVRRTPGPTETTAVFVHGLGGSSSNWTDLAAMLSGYANGIALDLPGTGQSRPPAGFTYSLDAIGDAVAQSLRAMGTGPVHLFGNSMGGAISMIVAARHPELVRTLTLVSPAVPDLRPLTSRMSDPRLVLAFLPLIGQHYRKELAALPPRVRAEQMMRLCFADSSTVPEQRIAEAAEEMAARMAHEWNTEALAASAIGLLRGWLGPRSKSLWATARRIQAPTLVVWGTEDKLVTVRKAPRTAALIPHARLLVLPRTGHVAQMERPVTVARAVLGMWATPTDRW